MPTLGLSEMVVVALIAIPGLALLALPVVAIVLWRRQSGLRARVERLEASLGRPL